MIRNGSHDRLGEVKTHDFWKPTRNLATGRFYIRTQEELICYRVKK